MFEMIGLFIGTAVEMILASCVGVVYALAAWLILPKASVGCRRRIGIAGTIPIISAAYLWLCVALLPGISLFGDIDQPLPNGYAITALGKMPEYGSIENSTHPAAFQGVGGSVDRLAVNGPLIAGRHCQRCNSAFVQSKKMYFVLDTRTGESIDYPDLATLQTRMGQPVQLVETQFFRSHERSYVWQQRIVHFIMFTPPISMTILYFFFLFRCRRGESQSYSSNLY